MRLKHLQTNRQFMIGNSIVFIGVIFVVVLFIYLSLRMQAQKSDHHYYNEVYNIGLVQGFAGHDFTVYMLLIRHDVQKLRKIIGRLAVAGGG